MGRKNPQRSSSHHGCVLRLPYRKSPKAACGTREASPAPFRPIFSSLGNESAHRYDSFPVRSSRRFFLEYSTEGPVCQASRGFFAVFSCNKKKRRFIKSGPPAERLHCVLPEAGWLWGSEAVNPVPAPQTGRGSGWRFRRYRSAPASDRKRSRGFRSPSW